MPVTISGGKPKRKPPVKSGNKKSRKGSTK